eukprot:4928499-Amphidinium_carterae.1
MVEILIGNACNASIDKERAVLINQIAAQETSMGEHLQHVRGPIKPLHATTVSANLLGLVAPVSRQKDNLSRRNTDARANSIIAKRIRQT